MKEWINKNLGWIGFIILILGVSIEFLYKYLFNIKLDFLALEKSSRTALFSGLSIFSTNFKESKLRSIQTLKSPLINAINLIKRPLHDLFVPI